MFFKVNIHQYYLEKLIFQIQLERIQFWEFDLFWLRYRRVYNISLELEFFSWLIKTSPPFHLSNGIVYIAVPAVSSQIRQRSILTLCGLLLYPFQVNVPIIHQTFFKGLTDFLPQLFWMQSAAAVNQVFPDKGLLSLKLS